MYAVIVTYKFKYLLLASLHAWALCYVPLYIHSALEAASSYLHNYYYTLFADYLTH